MTKTLADFQNVSFRHDMRRDGWELLEDVPATDLSVGIEVVPFLNDREARIGAINDKEMVRRAIGLGANLGQHDAEWLEEHQELIPTEFQDYYLVFSGTQWLHAGGPMYKDGRWIPFLGYYGAPAYRRWELHFDWLGYGHCGKGQFVRPRSR